MRARNRSAKVSSIVLQLRAQRTYAVLLQSAFADQLGINATDLVCGDLVFRNPGITPGELSSLTGLTSGAITAVIDHLEKAGYVRRQRDAQDKRRTRIHPVAARVKAVRNAFSRLNDALCALCLRFSPAQLAAIDEFIGESCAVMTNEIRSLRLGACLT